MTLALPESERGFGALLPSLRLGAAVHAAHEVDLRDVHGAALAAVDLVGRAFHPLTAPRSVPDGAGIGRGGVSSADHDMTIAETHAAAYPDQVVNRADAVTRRVRRGWRSRYPGDFPTLGWLALDWTHAYLPSPANEKEPLVYTDEQAHRVLEWFRLDALTGKFVYWRLHLQEAKGFGKSPFAASLDLLDFCGPVCFDGWDAHGQPVGVPWGTGRRPEPHVQIAAVSEAQTRNTYSTLYAMLVANDHRAAKELRIDDGRTRLYLRDLPKAILEPVTASAGSREGQTTTKATLDEPQLWTPSNGGHKLADTILGNLTKMNGRAVFTGNAYIKDHESVAERFDFAEPGVLRYARRPSEEPQRDWPRERLLTGLREVYADAWWIDPQRIVDDAISPTGNWERSKRLFWNIPSTGVADRWMPEMAWEACAGDPVFRSDLPTFAAVQIAHDHRAAAVAIAQCQGERVAVRARTFEADGEEEYLDAGLIEEHIVDMRRRYPARVQAAKRFSATGREYMRSEPGPEVAYHGSFFESSAQRLRALGIVMVDLPNSQTRLAPAAELLMERTISGTLVHDGDAELSRQMGNVVAKEADKGWDIEAPSDRRRIVAAQAVMVAVFRAIKAPAEPSRVMHRAPPR